MSTQSKHLAQGNNEKSEDKYNAEIQLKQPIRQKQKLEVYIKSRIEQNCKKNHFIINARSTIIKTSTKTLKLQPLSKMATKYDELKGNEMKFEC